MFSCKTPGNSISKHYSESFSKTNVFGKNVLSPSLLKVKRFQTGSNNPFISEFKDLQNKKIAKIKIAPNRTIYAGSSETGLWKSIDRINFNQVSTISNRCVIQSIDISSNGEIWVGTDEYLYFSNDNGISFNSMAKDKIQNVTTIAIAPNGNILVGAYGTGLWQLVKGDTDFKKIPSVLSSIDLVQN